MAILRNCCFCISLRNGGIILGVLSLAFAFLLFTTSCIAMYGVVNAKASPSSHQTVHNDDKPMKENNVAAGAWIFMAIYLGMCAITMICSAMLIYGAIKRRKNFILPFLVSDGIRIAYTVFYLIDHIFLAFSIPSEYRKGINMMIWGIAISLALQIYLWICVYSLYQSVREENQQRPNVHVAYHQQPAYNPHHTYSQVAKV